MSIGSPPSAASTPVQPETSVIAELELAARERNRGWTAHVKEHVTKTLLPRLAAGAVSGCLATVSMTAAMLALQRALPRHEQYPLPPRRIFDILARRLSLGRKVDRTELNVAAAIGHFGYGTAAGALYGPLGQTLPLPGVASGVVYGLLVWEGSYLGLLPALGILPPATQHPAGRNALMIAAHIVWGASLGWLAERFEGRPAQH